MLSNLFIFNFRLLIGQYVTIHDDVISHMNISEVESIDGGAYTCKAINTVGTVTHMARINVYGKLIMLELEVKKLTRNPSNKIILVSYEYDFLI